MQDGRRLPTPLVQLLSGRWTLAGGCVVSMAVVAKRGLHGTLERIAHKGPTDMLRRAERDALVVRRLGPKHHRIMVNDVRSIAENVIVVNS